ncbi:M48 family metallopeptidase [Spirulina sp. 06S082]|uniref:M48 family metallopeptidase n=1 Tax=Spirulina sp. 06S082 TaxID=3110248 RepID=UPI002B1EFA8F|nr:M48 family metallopeptidase [Spirulina sp. 06S082]MEA5470562.1 M48 family metallopeptidase [Spirulina sp. 06S082]
MTYKPKEITEEVNISKIHPLTNLAQLLGTVVGVSLAIYIALGLAVDAIVPRIPIETEKAIGDSSIASAYLLLGGTPIENDPRISHLQELLDSLQDPEDKIPLTLHFLKSPIVNAAAIPGGHVLVTTAFLDEVKSENELAFVLAHELGHLRNRDGLRGLGRGLVLNLGWSLVFGTSGSGDSRVVGTVLNLSSLNYSRSQESAADLSGLNAVIRRYGHGGHSLDLFKRLQEEETELKVTEYFYSHPLSETRVQKLEKNAEKNGWSMQGEKTTLPEVFSQ